MTSNWTSILGEYLYKKDELTFIGGKQSYSDNQQIFAKIGNFICDEGFGGGKISADVLFKDLGELNTCELILYYDPESKDILTAGIGGSGSMHSIRSFSGRWTNHSIVGPLSNLKANKTYRIEVEMKGSRVFLKVDGITVTDVNLPYNLPMSQVGIFCQSEYNIIIKNFTVQREQPRAFVVMQFSSPYNELYEDVIKGVCKEFKLSVLRGDETYGPGLILSDIIKQIEESKIVIAEISAANPNVFYEVGYAHALNKPTILIADKSTKLPFDVSPFRTLFYENSIAGKRKIEEGMRKHIEAVLSEKGLMTS